MSKQMIYLADKLSEKVAILKATILGEIENLKQPDKSTDILNKLNHISQVVINMKYRVDVEHGIIQGAGTRKDEEKNVITSKEKKSWVSAESIQHIWQQKNKAEAGWKLLKALEEYNKHC